MPATIAQQFVDEPAYADTLIIKYGTEYHPVLILDTVFDIRDYFYCDDLIEKSYVITDRMVIEDLLTEMATGTTSIEPGPKYQLPEFFIEIHSRGNKELICLSRFDDHKISFEDADKNYLLTNLRFYLKVVEIVSSHDPHWRESFFDCMIRIDAGNDPIMSLFIKQLDVEYKQMLSELYKKQKGKEIEWKSRPSSDNRFQKSE